MFCIRFHIDISFRGVLFLFRPAQLHHQCDDESASSSSNRRCGYQLLGQEIGLDCLGSILGVGRKRILRCQKGFIDKRYGEQLHRLSPKAASVDRFLLDLYGSIAETLPTQNPGLPIVPLSQLLIWDLLKIDPLKLKDLCHQALRFIQPNRPSRKLKPEAPHEVSIVTCEMGDDPSHFSDDELESDNGSDMDLVLPPEQLSEDLDLAAEMELDQQLWFRRLD